MRTLERMGMLIVALLVGGVELRAQLRAEPAVVELGRRKQEQTVTSEVLLKNIGPTPIAIISTHADCSCTVAKPETSTLEPGEKTILRVSVRTQTFLGPLRRLVSVETSAGVVSIPITLTVIAYDYWTLNPSVVIMRSSQKTAEAIAHATLSYGGDGKTKLDKLSCNPDYLEVTSTTEDGRKFDLTFKKRSDAPIGNHSVKVSLDTSAAAEPHVNLNVFLPVVADSLTKIDATGDSVIPQVALRVVPATIVLPTVAVGQRSTREITLQGWTSKAEPRIILNRGEIKLLSRQAGELHYDVSVAPVMPGSFTGALRVFDGDRLLLEAAVLLHAEPATSKPKP